LTKNKALKGDIKYHYGNLVLYGLNSAEGLELPEKIEDNLNLHNLTSAEKEKYPNLNII